MSRHPYEIIIRPLLTERSSGGAELTNAKYSFKVAMDSNKVQIRNAVEAAFGVKVLKVNTLRVLGKKKRLRSKEQGRRPHWKKAVITLAEGEEIKLL